MIISGFDNINAIENTERSNPTRMLSLSLTVKVVNCSSCPCSVLNSGGKGLKWNTFQTNQMTLKRKKNILHNVQLKDCIQRMSDKLQ